jgi:hypothetical protein
MAVERFPKNHAMYRYIKDAKGSFMLIHTADIDAAVKSDKLKLPSFKREQFAQA